MNDIKKHVSTAKHKENVKIASGSQSLTTLFRTGANDKVIRAEVLFANFVAEHNLSFSLADHFTHLTTVMFPDSKIAREFSCARTKTTCIIKGALSPYAMHPVFKLCCEGPFSILCDEGNKGDDKNFAILVRMWDDDLGKPATRFFDMPTCNFGDTENLFKHIDTALAARGVPWSNVVGFESDTTNAMMGKHNSVLSTVKLKRACIE